MMKIEINPLTKDSWLDVARIYESGILTKNATFQKEVPEWKCWDESHNKFGRLIAILEEKVVGWTALSPISSRCVYAGVAEVSIYVDPNYRGMGIGNKLLSSLIFESEKNGIWTLQAGIFPENYGSIKLHHNNGFRVVGVRQRLGKMDNRWRDVAILERRSNVVGID